MRIQLQWRIKEMQFDRCKIKYLLQWSLLAIGALAAMHSFADSDLLQGTTQDATSTLFGSGEIYFYIAELVAATIGYITTRRLSVFIGIIVVAFIFTAIAPHFLTASNS